MRQMQIETQSSRFYNIWNEYNLNQVKNKYCYYLTWYKSYSNLLRSEKLQTVLFGNAKKS